MEITAIEPRRHALSALYLDGEFAGKVDTEALLQSGYRLGMQLTDEQLHQLLMDSERRRAKEKALYLLEHRSHSRQELTDKLRRTVSPEAAEAAAEQMEALGLLDDVEYARRYATELLYRKGYAPQRVVYELTCKGIDKELAQELTEALAPDPMEVMTQILQKKYPACQTEESVRRRAAAALQRYGYRYDEIRRALAVFGETED